MCTITRVTYLCAYATLISVHIQTHHICVHIHFVHIICTRIDMCIMCVLSPAYAHYVHGRVRTRASCEWACQHMLCILVILNTCWRVYMLVCNTCWCVYMQACILAGAGVYTHTTHQVCVYTHASGVCTHTHNVFVCLYTHTQHMCLYIQTHHVCVRMHYITMRMHHVRIMCTRICTCVLRVCMYRHTNHL